MFLLIDNYDSFTYNLKALFESMGAEVYIIKNDEFIKPDKFEGIIISPGPSNPSNAGTSLKYISEYKGTIPIFGVCLGMQSICYVLGYNYRKARKIMHGKVEKIIKTRDSILLNNIPDNFKAVRYHSLVVDPPEEFITSISDSDNEAMSFENKELKLFAVQFHPESYLSEYGEDIVKNFINFCRSGGKDA
ncbi:MAG: aminodeoxychorismate/anthranilate synthase component II [Calditerrivibrio sp.]|nr:aminodeoxychorismate/anthranilate synthase component II [Calditerrivibrio sp.]